MGKGLADRATTGVGQLSFGDDKEAAKSKNGKQSPRIRTTNPIVMKSQSDFYSPTTTSAMAQSFNDTEDDNLRTEENAAAPKRKSKKKIPSQIHTEEDEVGEKLYERLIGITMHYVQEIWSQDGEANKLQVCQLNFGPDAIQLLR